MVGTCLRNTCISRFSNVRFRFRRGASRSCGPNVATTLGCSGPRALLSRINVQMKRYLAVFCWLVGLVIVTPAQDITRLEKIGSVTSFTKSDKSIVFNCQDHSQVQLTVLAPDLVRIRASFGKPIPVKDHSWAIAKTDWVIPRWSLSETSEAVSITTDELEVFVRRAPLLIEFRDAKTHAVINSDQQPMAYDPQGLLKDLLFDQRGTFVAVAKKLGF